MQSSAFGRGHLVAIFVAGGLGYLIGGWQTTALRSNDLSAAQSVALRFPLDWSDASPATNLSPLLPATKVNTPSVMGRAQLALLSPQPMLPETVQVVSPTVVQTTTAQKSAPEEVKSPPVRAATAAPKPPATTAAPAAEPKVAAATTRHRANPPGHLLDDAQIASIRERLHLTPDQEQMWPAVEAALRNIAYAKAQEQRRRGGAAEVQLASFDPNSAEVQGLKSAAVPLIMSFNAEQKEEVRNIVHVMGLDQLASQF
jgi:hypothetical protein